MAKSKETGPDWETSQFRHIALVLSYMGWNYTGLAMQQEPGTTIENHLVTALRDTKLIPPTATLTDMAYTRGGRTDAGVSATFQVISLYLRSKKQRPNDMVGFTTLKSDFKYAPPPWQEEPTPTYSFKDYNNNRLCYDEIDYVVALNSRLPDDIRVRAWAPAPNNFNARFCASSRTYQYTLPRENLNIEKMREACSYFLGWHDFRNFCKMDLENVNTFKREIKTMNIIEDDSAIIIELKGSAFLWHQVRYMVSILLMVGQELESPIIVKSMLDVNVYKAKPNYVMAFDFPLCLTMTEYENWEFEWQIKTETFSRLLIHAHRQYATHMIKAKQWEMYIKDHLNGSSSLSEGLIWNDVLNSEKGYESAKFYPMTIVSLRTRHKPIGERPLDMSYDEKIRRREENEKK